MTCALMVLCAGSLMCGSWDSLGCSSVCCDAQGLNNTPACGRLLWWCFQQHPAQLGGGDLVLCCSCSGEETGLAEEEQGRAGVAAVV